MAVKLIANYSKRLGLPGYSSHQFSVSVETELLNVDDVFGESARLYSMLQESVDQQMQETGFVPPDGYGMKPSQNSADGQSSNGTSHSGSPNGNGYHSRVNGNNGHQQNHERWNCTDGQKGLILRVVNESNLNKDEVEQMAIELFGCGVKALDKMQASQLIEELLEKTGKGKTQRRQWSRQPSRS